MKHLKVRSLIITVCGASLGRRIAVVTLLFALAVVVMMVSIFGTTLGSAIVEDQLQGACSSLDVGKAKWLVWRPRSQ